MRMTHRLLAGLALVAGLISGLTESEAPPLSDDEISALKLAQWIADRRPGLLLLDLRAPVDFDRAHLPGARPHAQFNAASWARTDTLVVYAERSIGSDALSAFAAQPDRPPVRRLRGGIQAWSQQVLFPTLHSDASAAQRRAFNERARLSRYFGGSPRVLEPGMQIDHSRSRRGC